MTKKIVRLTESDLEKIVRRVIKESMGVGFMSGEPNGLKIKRMESFLHIKPKDIKLLKEDIQKVFDLTEDSEELTEEDVVKYMELADFFQDIADDIKQKVKDITGYESEDDTEEAEEDNTPEKPVLG